LVGFFSRDEIESSLTMLGIQKALEKLILIVNKATKKVFNNNKHCPVFLPFQVIKSFKGYN
jgi:hypothetical protein